MVRRVSFGSMVAETMGLAVLMVAWSKLDLDEELRCSRNSVTRKAKAV